MKELGCTPDCLNAEQKTEWKEKHFVFLRICKADARNVYVNTHTHPSSPTGIFQCHFGVGLWDPFPTLNWLVFSQNMNKISQFDTLKNFKLFFSKSKIII
jgi:hypothetical protein